MPSLHEHKEKETIMATAKITYEGNLRTKAVHIKSGDTLITDAPIDNRGKGEAFSPTDLIATALGSCMLTIIGIRANDHNIVLGNIAVTITKHMADSPRKINKIEVVIDFIDGDYTSKEQKLLTHAAKTCPVALSLSDSIEQELTLNF